MSAETTPVPHLEALAYRLRCEGWYVHLATAGETAPRVQVVNPNLAAMNDVITVAPGDGGGWWFWWSFGTPLAPVEALDRAALAVARVLASSNRPPAPARPARCR